MATERQIAANRRNAAKSTGPRSAAGKRRSRGNAIRHGLFSLASRSAAVEEIEALARSLAGAGADDLRLAQARVAAEAITEASRAQRSKLALIERVESFGSLRAPRFFSTTLKEVRWYAALFDGSEREHLPEPPEPEDFLSSMPARRSERTIEAMRRLLPELAKLASYEKRAASRRDRSIRLLTGLR